MPQLCNQIGILMVLAGRSNLYGMVGVFSGQVGPVIRSKVLNIKELAGCNPSNTRANALGCLQTSICGKLLFQGRRLRIIAVIGHCTILDRVCGSTDRDLAEGFRARLRSVDLTLPVLNH